MYIIIDSENIIQDIASRKENLSRGYSVPGAEPIEIGNCVDCKVGDEYIGGKIIPNKENRTTRKKELIEHDLIDLEMKRAACQRLNMTEQQQILSQRITEKQNELASLSSQQV